MVHFLEVVTGWAGFEVDEGWQGKTGEAADGYFVRGDDFGAQVGGFDGAEVVLVRFGRDASSLAPVGISIM